MAEKTYSDKQLLALESTDGLSLDQIQRRITLVKLQTEERALDAANAENQKYLDRKEYEQRVSRAKIAEIKAVAEEQARIRTSVCRHKTGGRDKAGFFNGDGDIYGYCISREQLPTGEIYAICFRCQREWYRPDFRFWRPSGEIIHNGRQAVMRGEVTLKEYKQAEREYYEVMGWTCKSFSTDTGELPGGHMFRIPKLEAQQQKDAADFQAHLATLPKSVLIDAGVLI